MAGCAPDFREQSNVEWLNESRQAVRGASFGARGRENDGMSGGSKSRSLDAVPSPPLVEHKGWNLRSSANMSNNAESPEIPRKDASCRKLRHSVRGSTTSSQQTIIAEEHEHGDHALRKVSSAYLPFKEKSALDELSSSDHARFQHVRHGSVANACRSLGLSRKRGLDESPCQLYEEFHYEGFDLENTLSKASEKSSSSLFSSHPAVRPIWIQEYPGEAPDSTSDDGTEYPAPLPLSLIIFGICLSVLIISMDRNVITTAIPHITAKFHSYDDVGWYGSAYMLTASAFQPLYGRIYTVFDVKSSFLGSLVIFEIGSLIAALAPSSNVLIVGRAVQGLGSAGVLTGSFVVGTHSVRLHKRPILFAGVGILYATGALAGPLLGGVFSDTIGWRWCFWINLPVGLITFLTVASCFKKGSRNQARWLDRLLALDLIGNAILLGAATMLFLALQFSEQGFPWSSARIVGLLCGFAVTTIVFVSWIVWKDDEALLPPRILKQRTVAASCGAAFFIYGTAIIHAYYLPIWFQAVKGDSAIRSGVNMIPYICANAFFSLAAGVYVSKHGLFAPPAILGCMIGTIGCGLLATFKPGTSTSRWVGYEVIVSAGIGMAIQQGFSAVQTALQLKEVPIGTAMVVASQSLGGAVFVSVGNTLLQNRLLNADIPGVDVRAIIELGTTNFRSRVPAEALPELIGLYNESLQAVFLAAVPLCGVALICSLCMELRSVRKEMTGKVER